MFRKRPRRPRKPRVYRIRFEYYLVLLGAVFALSVAVSLLSRPKEVSYLISHEFSVRDSAFVPSAHALANPSPLKGNRIETLSNGDAIFPAMLAAIVGAKKTINLESYIFWSGQIAGRFRDSLAMAARRRGGPSARGRRRIRRQALRRRRPRDAAGIRIYEYQPTMLHSKTMVVDGLFATVGSTNFDNRSFHLNEELNLTVYDAAVAKRLEEDFWNDVKHSRPYTYQEWASRSLKARVIEWAIAPIRSQL